MSSVASLGPVMSASARSPLNRSSSDTRSPTNTQVGGPPQMLWANQYDVDYIYICVYINTLYRLLFPRFLWNQRSIVALILLSLHECVSGVCVVSHSHNSLPSFTMSVFFYVMCVCVLSGGGAGYGGSHVCRPTAPRHSFPGTYNNNKNNDIQIIIRIIIIRIMMMMRRRRLSKWSIVRRTLPGTLSMCD
jgi:hypothetical protein